ncbi:uncharacterized protein LOC123267180 [Cotesia glomerata]|uniref:uncharacterized protein LOC123267180 n=1 Tax=Cotesia glomerata TaxID=32391 RepID=UPI001D033ABC|nr:uncharacterized protein LOC123267180 [Cotesia glomerata]
MINQEAQNQDLKKMLSHSGQIISRSVNMRKKNTASSKERSLTKQSTTSFSVRKRLITTLIFPVFDYCAAVYTDLTGQQQLRLQHKLNACVRYIFKVSRFEHVTRYYKELCWLTLRSRRSFFMSCLIYKALYLEQKPLIGNNLQICESKPRRGDERNDLLVVPGCHSTKYDKSFLLSAIRVWNRLPSYCTSQPTFPAFRKACFEFLLSEKNA